MKHLTCVDSGIQDLHRTYEKINMTKSGKSEDFACTSLEEAILNLIYVLFTYESRLPGDHLISPQFLRPRLNGDTFTHFLEDIHPVFVEDVPLRLL